MGNLTRDDYKAVSVSYNAFNLPWEMDFGNNQKLNYHYDGSGKKLTKVNTPSGYYPTNTEYRGQMVHQSTNGVSSLKYIITPEGRLLNTGTNAAPVWGWEYDLKDHLGNTRVTFKPNTTNNGVVRVEYANYFPFGMKMLSPYSSSSTNKYLYNGKEMQDDFGLNWYDYGARTYDAAIGRWHSVDPMAEKYDCYSPFHFSGNNPIRFVDGNGMDWYSYTDDDGNKHYKYQDGSDESIKVGDNTYTNIGASVNIELGEGYYYNAFQNYGVTSTEGPIDVEQKILGSFSLQGRLLSEGSGFSAQGQAQIMTALINQGQSDFINHPMTQATLSGLMFVATGGIEGTASLLGAGRSLLTRSAGVTTTLHGAERIAGATATRGGVLSREGIATTKSLGRAISQADGATVYLHEISPGRYNAVVQGSKGIITTMENWSQKSILRIAKNYGWKL